MQFNRSMMRTRVTRRFGRMSGEHGDGHVPPFFPVMINPGPWGTAWSKCKDHSSFQVFAFVFTAVASYYASQSYGLHFSRTMSLGYRPTIFKAWSTGYLELDDPDFWIRYNEFLKECAENKNDSRWGGTNILASYLWEPGDPEPDPRRKIPVHGVH